MKMAVTSKNILGWLRLAVEVLDLDPWVKKEIKKYINRTDIVRRQKELDNIFGGEIWWI